MQYTEKELATLIETVEKEFTVHLSKAESLAKSEDSKPPKKDEKEEKPSNDAPPKKDAAPAPAAEEKPAAPAADAPPAAAPAPADAAAAPAPAEDHGYDPEDIAHMEKMYASMSRAELMAHHDAVRKALDAQSAAAPAPAAPGAAPAAPAPEIAKSEAGKSEIKDENPELNSKPKAGGKDMNGDAKNGGIEGQNPSGPKGATSEASKDSKNLHNAMSKTERQERNGGKIEENQPKGSPGAKSPASTDQRNLSNMEKSEADLIKAELDAEKAKNAELKKNFDATQEFLTKLVGKIAAPKGKAITEIAALTKNEGAGPVTGEMTKSEIDSILLKKSSNPNLSKSDRDAINSFYLNKTDVSTINHLLKN